MPLILTTHEDGVTTVALNHPEKRNPISDDSRNFVDEYIREKDDGASGRICEVRFDLSETEHRIRIVSQ